MPSIVELRQNRNLIRSNFDGYKLSLEPIPVLRTDLTTAPARATLSGEQYSLLHAELFSLQNLLQADPWARCENYHISCLGEVIQSSYNETTGKPEALKVVYRIKDVACRATGDYNYSMRFISERYCVLCDGVQHAFLLDTGDRLKMAEWKQVAETRIPSEPLTTEERGFMLYDCRLDTIQEQKRISLALGRIKRMDETADGDGGAHYLLLHWAKWVLMEGKWTFKIVDTLEGKGSLYYCAFEPRAESLIISSNRAFSFRSQNKPNVINFKVVQQPQTDDASGDWTAGYTWSQTVDDILITFNIDNYHENDYQILSTAERLMVKCADLVLLDIVLFAKVDQSLTTWTFEKKCLQITLMKHTASVLWSSLLAEPACPPETEDDSKENSFPVEPQPIANLEAPIEDCDFPMADDEVKIERFHLEEHRITHTVFLGTPPLFVSNLRSGFPLAIVLRQDVDATVWLQQYTAGKPNEWSLRHEGTLDAFGYVQASKQQKKFMDCSPDLNYALVCESHRHVFLYKPKYDTENELRSRVGPQVAIGRQHLINLPDDAGEVLGVTTAPTVATILTEKCVLYIQIC